MDLPFGVNDMRQVTGDMQHKTYDTCFFVSVLLYTHIARVSVSRMWVPRKKALTLYARVMRNNVSFSQLTTMASF